MSADSYIIQKSSMVSTSSKYLCPDFVLPATADSGKSPLALLTQTCNSIGQPDGQSRKKPLLAATTSPTTMHDTPEVDRSRMSDRRSPRSTKSIDQSRKPDAKVDRPNSSQAAATSRCQPSAAGISSNVHSAYTTPQLVSGLPYPHWVPPSPAAASVNPFNHWFSSLSAATTPLPYHSSLPFLTPPALSCLDVNQKSCQPATGLHPTAAGLTAPSSTQHDRTALWLNYASRLHAGQSSSSAIGQSTSPSETTTTSGDHVCYWVVPAEGRTCLQRFASSERLMDHMKTHATPAGHHHQPSSSSANAMTNNPFLASLSIDKGTPLDSIASPHRPLPGSVDSQRHYLNALRYHPYGETSKLSTPSAYLPPFPMLSSPTGYAALNALYGSRLPGTLPYQ